jgi:hypothetical protein
MAVRLSAISAGHPLPPGRFLVLISFRSWVNPGTIVRLEGLRKFKQFNNLIANRTCDLPAWSIVLRSTSLPRTPVGNYSNYVSLIILWPPLWSSGQSSWLQIRRPGFDSRHYQIFWKKKKTVAGLERGSLSLVSTTEELLDRKVAASV